MKQQWKEWLASIIPGILTLAVVFGPSKMTITTKLGSEYGYSMLWIIVVAVFFMAVFTNISSRIGLATNTSALTTIKELWGKKISVIIGVGIFLVTISFQAGNAIGTGVSLQELTGINIKFWVITSSLFCIALLFLKKFYKILEKIMIAIVILMLASFVITCIIAKPSVTATMQGFVPVIPDGSAPLIIAFIASTFSIVGAFYQSYLVQERKKVQSAEVIKDRSLTGIVLLGVMGATVMVCAAAVLHSKGVKINSVSDMGQALEPLFGKMATTIFMIGLFGASFSSLLGNATLGGTLMADSLGLGNLMDGKKVKFFIAAVIFVGATIATIFGKLPLELIIFAQSVTIFVVPVIGVAMFILSNNAKVMGNYKNSILANILGAAGLLLVFYLAFINFQKIFL